MKPYSENKKLKVIEMLAGPGAGKSSAALILAGQMKARGYKVEFIREIPKDLYWEERFDMFTEQDWILANQNNLFRRMLNHDIDYIVTDTSMLLGLAYRAAWMPKSFDQYLLEVYRSYDNISFYVDRGDIPYEKTGRNQDEEEAKYVDSKVRTILREHDINFVKVSQRNGHYDWAAMQMFNHIESLK